MGGEKKKSCRGETVSEQSATLPLKPIKPREAKRRKPETHPGPQSVDEAERDAAHTGCDLGWERGRVGGKNKVFAILRHTLLKGTVQQQQQQQVNMGSGRQ